MLIEIELYGRFAGIASLHHLDIVIVDVGRKADAPLAEKLFDSGGECQGGVHLGALPARLTLPSSLVVLPNGALVIADEAALLLATFD